MAIALRSVAHSAGNGNRSVTKPTGLATDDVLLADIYTDTTATITLPSGWIQLDTGSVTGGGVTYRHTTAYKRISNGAGEPASYTFTTSGGAGSYTEAFVSCWSGCDTTSPIDAHNAIGSNASTSPQCATITTGFANCMVVAMCIAYDGTNLSASGWTVGEQGASFDCGWLYKSFASAGATGAVTFSNTQVGTHPSSGSFISLKPATGGSSVTGAATISVDGNLSGAAVAAYVAASTLLTDANQSTTGKLAAVGAAALSSDLNLTAAAVATYRALATLAVSGNLTAAAIETYAAQATLRTDGNLTPAGVVSLIGAMALATNANLTATGQTSNGQASASLAVDAVLTATARVTYKAAATLSVDGNLSAQAAMALAAQVVVQAQANLSGTGSRAVTGAATLRTDAAISTLAALKLAAQIAVSANASVSTLAALALVGASALQTAANLTAAGINQNVNWRPPTATVLLRAAVQALLLLKSTPEGTIVLLDGPEGTIE